MSAGPGYTRGVALTSTPSIVADDHLHRKALYLWNSGSTTVKVAIGFNPKSEDYFDLPAKGKLKFTDQSPVAPVWAYGSGYIVVMGQIVDNSVVGFSPELMRPDGKFAMFDFSDPTTLFQDEEWTIPVTTIGQTVKGIKPKYGAKDMPGMHLMYGASDRKITWTGKALDFSKAHNTFFQWNDRRSLWSGNDYAAYVVAKSGTDTHTNRNHTLLAMSERSKRSELLLEDDHISQEVNAYIGSRLSLPLLEGSNRLLWVRTNGVTSYAGGYEGETTGPWKLGEPRVWNFAIGSNPYLLGSGGGWQGTISTLWIGPSVTDEEHEKLKRFYWITQEADNG